MNCDSPGLLAKDGSWETADVAPELPLRVRKWLT